MSRRKASTRFSSSLSKKLNVLPLESVIGMIPGMGQLKQAVENRPDEKQLARVEAIISSMTAAERKNDQIINGSRRKRIASGSGTSVEEVNRLLKQFAEMKKMLQMFSRGGSAAVRGMKGVPKIQQHEGFATPHGAGKKRKKGGPWGLIKSR